MSLEQTPAAASSLVPVDNDLKTVKDDLVSEKQEVALNQEESEREEPPEASVEVEKKNGEDNRTDLLLLPGIPSWSIYNTPAKPLLVLEMKQKLESMDSLELIFQQSVLGILYSLDIPSKSLAIEKLADLASEYLHGLVHNLHKLIEIQRRSRPALKDLKMLMKQNHLKLIDLYDEYKRSNVIISKDKSLQMLREKLEENTNRVIESKSNPDFEIDENDPSAPLFYNQTFEILDLIPSTTTLKFPKMFPQLPPDYTYKKTGSYNKLVTDPRIVREKLAEESRFGEKALNHLLHGSPDYDLEVLDGDDDNDDGDNEEGTLAGDEKVVNNGESVADEVLLAKTNGLIDQLPKATHATDITVPNPKLFDIEAFARQRLQILKKRRERIELEIKLKQELPINRISFELGSYTQKLPLKMKDDSVANFISGCLQAEFEQTQESVKKSTKKRRIRLKLEKQKRQKLLLQQELERQRNGIEQTFEFGNGDEEEEIDDFNFDFVEEDREEVINENEHSEQMEKETVGHILESNTESPSTTNIEGSREQSPLVSIKSEDINDVLDKTILTKFPLTEEKSTLGPAQNEALQSSVSPAPAQDVLSADEENEWDDDMFEDV